MQLYVVALVAIFLLSGRVNAFEVCAAGPNHTCISAPANTVLTVKQGDYFAFRVLKPQDLTNADQIYTATFWGVSPPAGFDPQTASDIKQYTCIYLTDATNATECEWIYEGVKTSILDYQTTTKSAADVPVPFMGYGTVPGNVTVLRTKKSWTIPTLNGTEPITATDTRAQYDTPHWSLPVLTEGQNLSVKWVAWAVHKEKEDVKFLNSASGEILIVANPTKTASENPPALMKLLDGPSFTDSTTSSAFPSLDSAGRVARWWAGVVLGLLSMYSIM
ncbi:hypothetical protein HK104_000916 [Borealophlyctis nickersoniae]|nr:hypothetical protein HK104_000916 [Borealophlyctis nickersoniae]